MISKWMPIETAPKDGKPIILVVKGYEPVIGKWLEFYDRFDMVDKDFLGPDMWEQYNEEFSEWPFTHWMPIPDYSAAAFDGQLELPFHA